MKPLWTPWRMPYILGIKASSPCVFCDEIFVESREPDLVLHQGHHCFVIMNLYPYAVGHLMVVPYRHVASLHEMTDDEILEMSSLLRRAETIVERELGTKRQVVGLNVGRCAGAGVEGHLHVHLVPEAEGVAPAGAIDDSSPMPESLPEELHRTRDRLARAWAEPPLATHSAYS